MKSHNPLNDFAEGCSKNFQYDTKTGFPLQSDICHIYKTYVTFLWHWYLAVWALSVLD